MWLVGSGHYCGESGGRTAELPGALFTPDPATAGFHVNLLTEYPDSAAWERSEEIFQPI